MGVINILLQQHKGHFLFRYYTNVVDIRNYKYQMVLQYSDLLHHLLICYLLQLWAVAL